MAAVATDFHDDYAPYFEQLISIQSSAISSFKRWVGIFIAVGIFVIGLALLLTKWFAGLAPQIVGIGGVFMSAAAVFPYREISPRESRIATYLLLKKRFEKFAELCPDEQKRLRDLADETIKKQI
ncbi:MAG TPA: hypothetical protein VE863_17740 [Pyrinomonadaceae bacterium]|jgi:hypothetical protein|nr:hypothetical protein [Pyrinomonadaceae bacterium]